MALIKTIGVSIILIVVLQGLFHNKEYKAPATKPISNERNCAIEALYFEGRNVSLKEKNAILDVVINRTKHKNYPSTICGVVHQPYQFSFRNNFKQNSAINLKFDILNSLEQKAYREIEGIVDSRLKLGTNMLNIVLPVNVTHYHTKFVSPSWSKDKKFRKILVDSKFRHEYYSYI